MSDLINRQAAIDTLAEMHCKSDEDGYVWIIRSDAWARIDALPSAERKGKWILIKGSNGKDYHKCSECLHTQEITGVKNYCAICGADMRGEEE